MINLCKDSGLILVILKEQMTVAIFRLLVAWMEQMTKANCQLLVASMEQMTEAIFRLLAGTLAQKIKDVELGNLIQVIYWVNSYPYQTGTNFRLVTDVLK
jgi:hypothetical protein